MQDERARALAGVNERASPKASLSGLPLDQPILAPIDRSLFGVSVSGDVYLSSSEHDADDP